MGPLAVSLAAFELPDRLLNVSMWRLLASAVCRRASRCGGKIPIADSKKLFSRQKADALEHLERGVLGILSACGQTPRSVRQLLTAIAPSAEKSVAQYPWYGNEDSSLPRCVDQTDVTLAGNSLRAAMTAAGISLVGIRSELVLAGEFNRLVAATNNKSTALFDVTSRLLAWLWQRSGAGRLRIYVDRQGGRSHYLAALLRVFQGCQFKVVEENDRLSAYRIADNDKVGEICFFTEGEARQLPVALASMVSKYLRELFMEMLNRFWARCMPGLKPTAGYYTDGRRFYEEIKPVFRRLGLDERMFYRSR